MCAYVHARCARGCMNVRVSVCVCVTACVSVCTCAFACVSASLSHFACACVCVSVFKRACLPLCVSARTSASLCVGVTARVCVRARGCSLRAHTPYPWRTPRTSRCARARARAGGRARRGRCNRTVDRTGTAVRVRAGVSAWESVHARERERVCVCVCSYVRASADVGHYASIEPVLSVWLQCSRTRSLPAA